MLRGAVLATAWGSQPALAGIVCCSMLAPLTALQWLFLTWSLFVLPNSFGETQFPPVKHQHLLKPFYGLTTAAPQPQPREAAPCEIRVRYLLLTPTAAAGPVTPVKQGALC